MSWAATLRATQWAAKWRKRAQTLQPNFPADRRTPNICPHLNTKYKYLAWRYNYQWGSLPLSLVRHLFSLAFRSPLLAISRSQTVFVMSANTKSLRQLRESLRITMLVSQSHDLFTYKFHYRIYWKHFYLNISAFNIQRRAKLRAKQTATCLCVRTYFAYPKLNEFSTAPTLWRFFFFAQR